MAHRLVSSKRPTRYASAASCSAATAELWNRRSVLKSWAISLTSLWKGSFLIRSSVLFWYFRISLSATVPGLNLCGFFTPPVAGADFLAAFVASCFLGAFPPVDFLAVCFRTISWKLRGCYKGTRASDNGETVSKNNSDATGQELWNFLPVAISKRKHQMQRRSKIIKEIIFGSNQIIDLADSHDPCKLGVQSRTNDKMQKEIQTKTAIPPHSTHRYFLRLRHTWGRNSTYDLNTESRPTKIDLKLDTKKPKLRNSLSPFTADSASKLDVLGHDGDPLGMNGAQIGVLEETHQVRLRRLLQSCHGGALEPEVRLEVLGDFPDQSLEGQLPDQQLGALLVLPNLPQRHSPRPESVRLLDPSGGGSRFPRRLGRQLLPRRLPSGGLPCRLLGTCHLRVCDF
ncbi:hypothetical protein RJ640_029538 [Escallonia rubra]|uniref:Uncharacterized protein n=1 Tax=Escallonia rubra TaxID=112253 RepID=A0AA88QI02_9ASTE|nr:hypothetical protein RJ640_029538 [Escallonia rubra]